MDLAFKSHKSLGSRMKALPQREHSQALCPELTRNRGEAEPWLLSLSNYIMPGPAFSTFLRLPPKHYWSGMVLLNSKEAQRGQDTGLRPALQRVRSELCSMASSPEPFSCMCPACRPWLAEWM